MDLALNNLQRLIYYKTQPTDQPTKIKTGEESSSIKSLRCGCLWEENSGRTFKEIKPAICIVTSYPTKLLIRL